MSFLKGILDDLREKRLWPLAVVLAAGLIAVPVLVAKSPSSTPVASVPVAPTGTSGIPVGLPAVSVDNTIAHSRLTGAARDPFGASGATPLAVSGSTTSTATAASSTTSKSGSSSAKSSGSSKAAGTTTSTSSLPSPIVPLTVAPRPPAGGLTPTESWGVTFAMTDAFGGLDTIDPLERLSIIPNREAPLLVELGVLKGGHRVLFAVQPGAVLGGPGTCTPGPVDCEILSLAPDQIESLANATGPIALFAVTGINVVHHKTVAAANRDRRKASAAGAAVLASSTSTALSLFQYRPSLGSIVDLRNLKVGG